VVLAGIGPERRFGCKFDRGGKTGQLTVALLGVGVAKAVAESTAFLLADPVGLDDAVKQIVPLK